MRLDNTDRLLRLLAVFIHRSGGETVISETEFDFLEGAEVVGFVIEEGYLRLRVVDSTSELIDESTFPTPTE